MAREIAEAPPRVEPEIVEPVRLCDSRGRLREAAIGWSRRPLHTCNLRGSPFRKKRWNYWAVTSDRYLFPATVAHLDYLALAFVYFLDFETGRFVEKSVPIPFGRGVKMPERVEGDIRFRHRSLKLALANASGDAKIRAKAPRFGGSPMSADIAVSRPAGHETLNVVIPWSHDRFQFTSKQNTLPASGTVRIGDDEYAFEEGRSFACLNYGRGVWKLDTFWNWGAASGVQDGRIVGLNLGGGWTDGTGMTENAICVDGRLTKLGEDLRFDYDPADFKRPWRVTSVGTDRVDLTLVPFYERVAKTDLGLLKSEVHQVFGRYAGTVIADDIGPLKIDGLIGWVEQHEARW